MNTSCASPADDSHCCFRATPIRHNLNIDAGGFAKHCANDVAEAAKRSGVELAWIGLCITDQFGNITNWKRRACHKQKRILERRRDRREILDWVERRRGLQKRPVKHKAARRQQRVTVRVRLRDIGRANDPPGSRSIFNDDRLAEGIRQRWRDKACDQIGGRSRRKRDD